MKHQKLVYPNSITFNSPPEQEAYVRKWLEERVSFHLGFEIRFYPGKENKEGVEDFVEFLLRLEKEESVIGYGKLTISHIKAIVMATLKQRPLPDYLEKAQNDLTPAIRGVLVEWLVEVAGEYKLVSDKLYLTVSYIDRFLSTKTINRKYEEISRSKVEDFCYITDNTFTKEYVVKMEADMLLALQFELGNPTIKTFLRRFIRCAQEDFKESHLQIEFLCCYLSELSLLDYNCVKFLPSLLAASAVFLARFIIHPKQHPWISIESHDYLFFRNLILF